MPALESLFSTIVGFLLPLPLPLLLRSIPKDAIAPVSSDATKVLSIFICGKRPRYETVSSVALQNSTAHLTTSATQMPSFSWFSSWFEAIAQRSYRYRVTSQANDSYHQANPDGFSEIRFRQKAAFGFATCLRKNDRQHRGRSSLRLCEPKSIPWDAC